MKKILIGVGVAIVVVVIAAVVIVSTMLGSIVKEGVERGGPPVLGVPVKLESASVSVFSGSGELDTLTIGNPEGYQTDSSFKVGNVQIRVDTGSLRSDVIRIHEIIVDGAEVTFEINPPKATNLTDIMNHVNQVAGAAEEAPEKAEAAGPKLIIERFVMKNTKARLSAKSMEGRSADFTVPDLELKDLGAKSNGQTAAELAPQVVVPVIKQVIVAAKEQPAFREFGGEVVNSALGKVEAVKEKAKGMVDKVKGLFGGGE